MPSQLPRINVVVTEEQHALLLELAKLDPETRSASAFLRALLDRVTPLLRSVVPAMRMASQEMASNREELRGLLAEISSEMQQLDLQAPARRPPERSGSDGGRTARRPRKR